MAIFFTLRVFARNQLRGNRRRNTFFCILFLCLAWGSNPGFSSNKPTKYLLDHGDFIFHQWLHEHCPLKRQLPLACRRNIYLWRHPTNNSPTVAADNAIIKNRAQNIECYFGCVTRSAVLLKPNVATIILFNFCEKKFVQHSPIMPQEQNPHQTVNRFECVGSLMYACGFSVSQMRQFCLFTYPPRSKWASSAKIIFFCQNRHLL